MPQMRRWVALYIDKDNSYSHEYVKNNDETVQEPLASLAWAHEPDEKNDNCKLWDAKGRNSYRLEDSR